MDAKSLFMRPHLIKEVPDFKGFINSIICKEGDMLEAWHTMAQQIKLYQDSNGWPLMQ
jgi:hypothetical protein